MSSYMQRTCEGLKAASYFLHLCNDTRHEMFFSPQLCNVRSTGLFVCVRQGNVVIQLPANVPGHFQGISFVYVEIESQD